jgi:hypothetical protein
MRRGKPIEALPALTLAVLLLSWTGCSKSPNGPTEHGGIFGSPETELTFGPLETDTTSTKVHFYWYGTDRDGEVVRFRFATDADTAKPLVQWRTTRAHDSTFVFLVDPVNAFLRHVFMVSAEDNDGRIDPTPARRFFSAKTLPPTSCIVRGPAAFNATVGSNFTFEMSGTDPDGSLVGTATAVDSFQYMLLQIGYFADPIHSAGHAPLPPWDQATYVDLLNRATGDSLPAPYGDWKWTGLRGTSKRFTMPFSGECVFAVRAVDVAGAHEPTLEYGCNIRHFTVQVTTPPLLTAPTLTVRCNLVVGQVAQATGTSDLHRDPFQVFEGEAISFAWTASENSYGDAILGYSFALDDTTMMLPPDPATTGVTITQDHLPPGNHTFYVRVVDVSGGITTASIPFEIVRPIFKQPGATRQVLYVDDFTSPVQTVPGIQPPRVGNYPSDTEEDSVWIQVLLPSLGVPFAQWDCLAEGVGSDGRKPPPASVLANYSTVIWSTDFNNPAGIGNGLWRALVGASYSVFADYLRAGGTLILTGFQLAANTCNPNTIVTANSTYGICAAIEPGTFEYDLTYFPRGYMGIDGVRESTAGKRSQGARDFVAAYPTPFARMMSVPFDTARVDTGAAGSGVRWVTYFSGDLELNGSPGLPRVDGWNMASDFGCQAPGYYRVETQAEPIAAPIYVYHGVDTGVYEDGGPSPREGLVCGIRTQAHDLGGSGSSLPVAAQPAGALGRMVHIGFPLYFLHDPQGIQLLQAAFAYANASPTLP